jgi:two-component system, LytTR family, sensor kinase
MTVKKGHGWLFLDLSKTLDSHALSNGLMASSRPEGRQPTGVLGSKCMSGQPESTAEISRATRVVPGGGVASPWKPGRELMFWILHLSFWAVVSYLLLLAAAVYRPQFGESPVVIGARVIACLVATAGMRRLSKLPRLLERLNVTRAGLVAGGLLTSAVGITLAFGLVDGVFTGEAGGSPRSRLMVDLAGNATLLGSWCAIYFGLQLIYERSTAELRVVKAEAAVLRTELHKLQSQISPHFLFNSLNTVLASRDDPEAIETVTHALAGYLRFLLRPAAPLEPLGRELDAMEQYLTVQAIRFGTALVTEIDCEEQVRGVLVPPVMVQPLVENALKYGDGPGGQEQRIVVTARRAGNWLLVEVANRGSWLPPGHGRSAGTGLESLARRLELLIGPTAGLEHSEQDGTVRVQVRIPFAVDRGRQSAC